MAEKSGIDIFCEMCQTSFDFPEPEGEPRLNEFGEYENPGADCPGCAEKGIQTRHFIVLNIPETEFDEAEIDNEEVFPPGEYEKRQAVRNLMWRYRPDLKKKDRAKHEKQIRDKTEKKKGKKVEEIRAERKNRYVGQAIEIPALAAFPARKERDQRRQQRKDIEAEAARIIADLQKPAE